MLSYVYEPQDRLVIIETFHHRRRQLAEFFFSGLTLCGHVYSCSHFKKKKKKEKLKSGTEEINPTMSA